MAGTTTSRKRGVGDNVAMALWLLGPLAGCLGFAYAAGLGASSGHIAAILLAVAAPVLGAVVAEGSGEAGSSSTSRSMNRAWLRAMGGRLRRLGVMLAGVLVAAVVMNFGAVETGGLVVLLASLVMLGVFGWGVATLVDMAGAPRPLALVLVGALACASAGVPFWTDRMVASREASQRMEFRGSLAEASTSLTLSAEVFGEQLLQKPWLYMQGKSDMAGMQMSTDAVWLGGWRLWAIMGGGLGLVAMGWQERRTLRHIHQSAS